ANQDLVTAMSHVLSTPLTSLLCYLDILDMKIYKNEEERSEYIRKCKIKSDQIKYMSDLLFTHFLIYAQDDNIQLQLMD
ncbi:histidine kinase dimerization/phospho-acceptor domain-containing protein, partial [Longicatena caecimuris]|uniref:histidine kinase dimerization/phospho-acceptor domain-containing protein n=1 Tax=Longicatena caecimuris TaxID=1796635 RepID=UPI0034E4E4EE|nr:sensor histidine kinase [Longicatena caecimuris]